MLKFGTSNIGKVFAGTSAVAAVYSGNNLIWQSVVPEEMLVFTGIDANGNYELDEGYSGATAYVWGDPYSYWKYEQITPTPTTASGYSGKYVYDTSTSIWNLVYYNTSDGTLTPSWVVVGTTPAYNKVMVAKTDQYDEFAKPSTPKLNNGFNNKFFSNITAQQMYGEIMGYSNIPTLSPAIGVVTIPDTYKGLPVTQVLRYAYYSDMVSSSSESYTIMGKVENTPTYFILGANIVELQQSAFYGSTTTKTIVFNNNLQILRFSCLSKIFTTTPRPTVTLPASVNSIAEGIFGTSSNDKVGKVILNGPFTSASGTTLVSYPIGSSVYSGGFVVFNQGVTSISGGLCGESGAKLVFMHSANASITLNITKPKSAYSIDIYTDNTAVRNYDWATQNYTVTFHPLSDYTGS